MRAAVARAGRVELEIVDDPDPGAGQVLVEPIACGICGSDLHMLETQGAMPELVPPMTLGHEFVGRVLEYGPRTERRLPVGSVVTSVPYLDTAGGPQLIGLSPLAAGGLAERMLLQERRLLPVPSSVPPHIAALVEPLAVGEHAAGAARLENRDVALVIGCGPVGLATIMALKARGHGPVVAADFSGDRRQLAELVGADLVVDPAQSSPYAAWSELAGPAPPLSPLWEEPLHARTVVFECVGVQGLLQSVLDAVPPHTRVVVVGVCQTPDTIIPAVAITKEISLQFVFAYRPDEFAATLGRIAAGQLRADPLITAVLPLEQVPAALSQLAPPSRHCKILITPNGEGT